MTSIHHSTWSAAERRHNLFTRPDLDDYEPEPEIPDEPYWDGDLQDALDAAIVVTGLLLVGDRDGA